MRILLTGGGSGGHAIPLIAVFKELNNQSSKKIKYLWIGSKKGIEKQIARNNNIDFKYVLVGKWRRYISIKNIFDVFKIPIGIIQSFFIIRKFKPNLIFSKGGFVSIPPAIAGRLLKVPIFIHESDIYPGFANRILARFSNIVAISFKKTKNYFKDSKIIFTGNPIRNEILIGSKKRGINLFSLEYGIPVVLLAGGSQGARFLNNILLRSLNILLSKYQIIHICGEINLKDIKEKIENLNLNKKYFSRYHLYTFLPAEKMGDAIATANLVVSRAGSSMINEVAALGKPSILIPLSSSAGDHQNKNARYFEKNKAAIVVKENSLTPEILKNKIDEIFSNPAVYDEMSANALKLSHKEAAKNIAKQILKLSINNASI